MLGASNTKILWGDLIITDMFDLISTDDPPKKSALTFKQETMANGNPRTIASANNERSYSITVNRDVADDSDIDLLEKLFRDRTNQRLRIINSDNGKVLIEYKKALLADDGFLMGATEDAKGVDVKITWSVWNA